jgi:hypothetical protein
MKTHPCAKTFMFVSAMIPMLFAGSSAVAQAATNTNNLAKKPSMRNKNRIP